MKIKGKHIILFLGATALATMMYALFSSVHRPDVPAPLSPEVASLPSAVAIKGTVEKYGSNPDKDIDKLLLKSEGAEQWLHFPPHTAKEVLAVAHINDVIKASARSRKKPAPDDIISYELVSFTNLKTGREILLTGISPPPPDEGKEIEISGNILDYNTDMKGHIRGIIINHNLIVLPPQAGDMLQPLLMKNKLIVVKGKERSRAAGFVNENDLPVIRARAIIINGTQYLL